MAKTHASPARTDLSTRRVHRRPEHVPVGLDLPGELVARVRAKAERYGLPFRSVVQMLLSEWLDQAGPGRLRVVRRQK